MPAQGPENHLRNWHSLKARPSVLGCILLKSGKNGPQCAAESDPFLLSYLSQIMATISFTFVALLVLLTFPIIFLFWVTESKTARAKRLRAKGWTYKNIAKSIGMSETTARKYCRVAVA